MFAQGGSATAFGRRLVATGCLGSDSLRRAEKLVRHNLWICPDCLTVRRIKSQAPGSDIDCTNCGSSHPLPQPQTAQVEIVTTNLAGDETELEPGEQFAGYQIIERIGLGGMGVVYRAHDPRMDRSVALKVHEVRADCSRARAEAFMREARMVAQLSHPHINPVHALGRVGPRLYFTMDLVRGFTLRQAIIQQRIGLIEACLIGLKLADALDYIHGQGIAHRDVNPRNILLNERNEPMLIDFGIALPLASGADDTGPVMGTPAYMPPEEAIYAYQPSQQTRPAADPRGDVYSLGATLYQLMTGMAPFRIERGEGLRDLLAKVISDPPPRPSELNSNISPDIEAILLTALAKRPDQRYPSASAMRDDLRRLLNGEPIAARNKTVPERFWNLLLGR